MLHIDTYMYTQVYECNNYMNMNAGVLRQVNELKLEI